MEPKIKNVEGTRNVLSSDRMDVLASGYQAQPRATG
jgi:hypothetical protein